MAPQAKFRENVDGNRLDLSMSGFTEVPVKDIAAIKKATVLDLSNNKLTILPPTFCTLTHLVELDLSKNMLRELPESFGSLEKLKRLDLYGNELTHLPLSFCRLKALKWLDLKNNPLVPMLAEIAGPCGDPQQCQQCARNVVATLTKTAIKVEEDRQRLLEEKLREQEQIEQEYLLKKKELDAENNKKAKKKTKKGVKVDKQALDVNGKAKSINAFEKHSGNENTASSKGKKPTKEPRGSSEKPVGFFKSITKVFLKLLLIICTSAVLLFVSGIIFAAYDRKSFLQLVEDYGIASNDLVGYVTYCAKHAEHAAKHPFLKEMRSQLAACVRSIVASSLNIYKTICQEFPVYYDVVKSKFL